MIIYIIGIGCRRVFNLRHVDTKLSSFSMFLFAFGSFSFSILPCGKFISYCFCVCVSVCVCAAIITVIGKPKGWQPWQKRERERQVESGKERWIWCYCRVLSDKNCSLPKCVCLLAQSAVAAAAAFELPQRTRLVAYGRVAWGMWQVASAEPRNCQSLPTLTSSWPNSPPSIPLHVPTSALSNCFCGYTHHLPPIVVPILPPPAPTSPSACANCMSGN